MNIVLPLQKYIKEFQKEITIEAFNAFYNCFMTELSKSFPVILKVIMKIIYIEVDKDHLHHKDTDKGKEKEKDIESPIEANSLNYTPLMTMLMFNFFISPKMQDIYSISAQKYIFMRNVNRIIRV